MSFFTQRGISTFWGISIILMEVTVVLFVFYILYFFWIENPTPTSNILIIRTFRHNVVEIPRDLDTSTWRTYRSEPLGITFQYPPTYELTVDDIVYGTYEGALVELDDTGVAFTLRAFPILTEDGKNPEINDVFRRLTSINPSVYQSYDEKVGGRPAVVYRQVPGDPPQDHIYYMNDTYFFESVFNSTSAPILGTVQYIE